MSEALGDIVARSKKHNELLALMKDLNEAKYGELGRFGTRLGQALLDWRLVEHKAYTNYDSDWAEWVWPNGQPVKGASDFATSIDAALILFAAALPGWSLACLGQDDSGAWHAEFRKGHITAYSMVEFQLAATPALAIVLAVIQVRIEELKR